MKTEILTRDFLNLNRTPKGGYTKEQLRMVGVAWPPEKDWQKRIIGTTISASLADAFANARHGTKADEIAKAVAKERERCAALAEDYAHKDLARMIRKL